MKGETTVAPTHAARSVAARDVPPLRFVTAASLFDGHDAAINIMRRILQSEGAEVIHLGHDRSVDEVVDAAVEEDAHAIAVSSYQGGHCEYFDYMVRQLERRGRADIRVFGGGGGTITDKEIAWLHERGIARIYSVEDGRKLGLVGMIRDMMARATRERDALAPTPEGAFRRVPADVGVFLTQIERLGELAEQSAEAATRLQAIRNDLAERATDRRAPIIGVTGTGGAGKSSLTDELVRRLRLKFPRRSVAVLSVDPTRRRTGGALLGDRIRMNAVFGDGAFMRSMATRRAHVSISSAVTDALAALRAAGYDLIILETAGIGQSGTEVVDVSDLSVYVMTPEYGAPSQLEKIDMLDFADVVAINKADKAGADDAVRYVRKQVQRNRAAFDQDPSAMPVFPCVASRFGDAGVTALFEHLASWLQERDPTL